MFGVESVDLGLVYLSRTFHVDSQPLFWADPGVSSPSRGRLALALPSTVHARFQQCPVSSHLRRFSISSTASL